MECKMEIKVESPDCTADTLFLHLPRERDVWGKLQRTVGEADELTCDLSQSLGRNRVQVDGRLGTITPGSHLIVRSIGRAIIPYETLLLHAFPIHRMNFASSLSQKDLAVMGGNAMHVQVVGVAMLLALFLVDWEKCQDPPLGAPGAPVVAKAHKAFQTRSAAHERALQKRFGLGKGTTARTSQRPGCRGTKQNNKGSKKRWSHSMPARDSNASVEPGGAFEALPAVHLSTMLPEFIHFPTRHWPCFMHCILLAQLVLIIHGLKLAKAQFDDEKRVIGFGSQWL